MKLLRLSRPIKNRFPLLCRALLTAFFSGHLMAGPLVHEAKSQSHPHQEHTHAEHKHTESEHTHQDGEPQGEQFRQPDTAHEHDETQTVTLTQPQMATAQIQVQTLQPQVYDTAIYAPGEVKANGYTSYIVSPRTESVILSRGATLGEHVKKGQPLITLFSEAVAQAQAVYLVASSEWQRVNKLGSPTISESQLLKAKAEYRAAKGRLTAFGLTAQAIDNINQNASDNLGQYTLTAKRAGVVLQDDFSQGQRIKPGQTIMLLADENSLWVEARISPNKKLHLTRGSAARVSLDGHTYPAKVIQEAHTIDPITRTRVIRLSVDNQRDSLHSGMFVDVYFHIATETPVLAVPESALVRLENDQWRLFVQKQDGSFESRAVTPGRPLGEFREISGLAPGSRVVVRGAFFLASEIAKGGFDPHNH